jgi:hypothetical protein
MLESVSLLPAECGHPLVDFVPVFSALGFSCALILVMGHHRHRREESGIVLALGVCA